MKYKADSCLTTADRHGAKLSIEGGTIFRDRDIDGGDLDRFLKLGACRPFDESAALDASDLGGGFEPEPTESEDGDGGDESGEAKLTPAEKRKATLAAKAAAAK